MIEDKSFSGINALIQGDEKEAKKALVKIIKESLDATQESKRLEQLQWQVNAQIGDCKQGIKHICQHIKLGVPFTLIASATQVYYIDEHFNITQQNNVL
ncbi:hypothetical protein [Flavobacterium cerinum]|uniref:Uncharacterized protein n=1 Tax=Flavobacterium cerinum TaxID=2502784 RepID=A0A3S3QDL7_9FLAO|nr:hypothetical protein [Flavobacterium cerinum]RWX00944.1 hypothetical protein EPI11_07940 [Flavobacterium cerinum]